VRQREVHLGSSGTSAEAGAVWLLALCAVIIRVSGEASSSLPFPDREISNGRGRGWAWSSRMVSEVEQSLAREEKRR
jgi:hypothetical protein